MTMLPTIGGAAYVHAALENGERPPRLRVKEWVAHNKRRCRDLGLPHDADGFPKVPTDEERLAAAAKRGPQYRDAMLRKIAGDRAAAIRRDRKQSDARIAAFAARMVATATEAARTSPVPAMWNTATGDR